MRITKKPIATPILYISAAAIGIALCFCSVRAEAQEGNNVVFNTSGGTADSYAFVDASAFDTGTGDVCYDIYHAFSGVYTGAPMAVIDARGITPGSNICATSPFPSGAVPSLILLPAGVIGIQTQWVLPDRTRVIGQGADPTVSGTNGTILQATSNFVPTSGYMIEFGSSSLCPPVAHSEICNGIGVENLTLDGFNSVPGGIQNIYGQERSYVNHVSLRNFNGTGLDVGTANGSGGGQAQNSGPYSNITFLAASGSSANCATMNGIEGSRGIHNLKCTGSGSGVGIYLDASGNTLEDIVLNDFTDGIQVGANRNAAGNALLNIIGGTGITNSIIHVENTNSVTDLTIMQVKNGATNVKTIEDDAIPTPSGFSSVTDSQVAIYALGEPMSGGYSRFTTAIHSHYIPTWLVGNGAASGPCTSVLETGTLYSDMTSSDAHTLYLCNGVSWAVVK